LEVPALWLERLLKTVREIDPPFHAETGFAWRMHAATRDQVDEVAVLSWLKEYITGRRGATRADLHEFYRCAAIHCDV